MSYFLRRLTLARNFPIRAGAVPPEYRTILFPTLPEPSGTVLLSVLL